MLKALNQWCFPEDTSLEQVFEHSQKAGYDAVELNVYEAGGIGLTLESSSADAEQIGRLANQYGLKLRSLSTGLLWKTPLSSADESVREQGRSVIIKQMELANILGCDTVLVVPGVVNKQTSYDDCYERSQQELHKLVPTAERLGVSIGIENVWNKFLLSPLEMARYIDELNSPNVGAYFDVGNVLQFGFPEQWIRILNKRIRKIHVKDFNTGAGNIQGFVPLLSGNVDWPDVVNALREIGYTDTVTAELSPYKAYPIQMVYDTARHLEVAIHNSTI